MSPGSAAMKLRDSFGDRKIPEISRRIKACVTCRKLKIKCQMDRFKPPCTRCKAQGIACTVTKSLQMLLENDATWKEVIEQRLDRLEESAQHEPRQKAPNGNDTPTVDNDDMALDTVQLTPIDSSTTTVNLSCSRGAFPASALTHLPRSNESGYSGEKLDVIESGLLSIEAAEQCFAYFQEQLNPFLHYLVPRDDTLQTVRARSSLLTSAICTVASHCTLRKECPRLVEFLKKEVSSKTFCHKYTFDDVRALCIGAFWLNEVSSSLNLSAVRIATELDLHRCITKMPHTKRECYDRTRLYFIVYLVDHHCSLVYGRPPLTRELRSLKIPRAFLRSEFCDATDPYLISQVELWSMNRGVFIMFGADVERPIQGVSFTTLERLGMAYDKWHAHKLRLLDTDHSMNESDRQIMELYLHSAKLCLFSHIFRGPAQGTSTDAEQRADYEGRAVDSALGLLQCLITTSSNERYIFAKLPAYFGIMCCFASVYLVETRLNDELLAHSRSSKIRNCADLLADAIRSSSVSSSATHPWIGILNSLETNLGQQAMASPRGLLTETPDGHLAQHSGFQALPDEVGLDFSFPKDSLDWPLLFDDSDWQPSSFSPF